MIPIMKPTLPSLDAIESALSDILVSGSVTSGKYVDEFERRCADYLGSKWAVAVSSGTTSLTLPVACMGLTGEVIVPSFSWCASAHVLREHMLDSCFGVFPVDVMRSCHFFHRLHDLGIGSPRTFVCEVSPVQAPPSVCNRPSPELTVRERWSGAQGT